MNWKEALAIGSKASQGDWAGAGSVPLQAEQTRKRTAAIKSGASNGARNFPSDIWRNEFDGSA